MYTATRCAQRGHTTVCFPASMRSASFIALGLCFALFAWRVADANHDADFGGWSFVEGPLIFAAVVAAMMSVAVALFLWLSRPSPPGGVLPWFVMAIAVALVLAI